MNGIESIAAERQRQIDKEGWTPDHDDTHNRGELAKAAAVYAWASTLDDTARQAANLHPRSWPSMVIFQRLWPWEWKWWKPKDRRADLVRAGALIAAEIDRLDRLAAESICGERE